MIKLGDFDSPFGPVTILRARSTGTVIYEQAGHFQSECDGDGTSLAPYIHALFGLIWEANANSVLVIGCGGGTLGTMLARSGRDVTIVDIDPVSFPLARTYFNLPDSVRCEVADGGDFLRSNTRSFDAIILDAYHGDRIPDHFQSNSFFQLVRSRLNLPGALFINIHVRDDMDFVATHILERMADVWPQVRLLDSNGMGGRNAIAMAGSVTNLSRPHLLIAPSTSANAIDAELAMMSFRELKSAT